MSRTWLITSVSSGVSYEMTKQLLKKRGCVCKWKESIPQKEYLLLCSSLFC